MKNVCICASSSFIQPSLSSLQAPWDGTDQSSPAHHMFNESDPILGPSTLETGFLEEDEEAQRGDRGEEEGGTLEECLGLPPSSSPSHPSAGDSVEPLTSTYMLFKVVFCILYHQGTFFIELMVCHLEYENHLYSDVYSRAANGQTGFDLTRKFLILVLKEKCKVEKIL